jgi:hypothetical protein
MICVYCLCGKIMQPGAVTTQVSVSVVIVNILMKFGVCYSLELKCDARLQSSGL